MNIIRINSILKSLRNGTAWTLSDADLSLMENDDPEEWPVPPPNAQERNPVTEKPWLPVYLGPGITGQAGWSEITDAIRARRPKPVAVVIAVQPAPAPAPVADEADEIIARLRRESEEADEHLRQIEAWTVQKNLPDSGKNPRSVSVETRPKPQRPGALELTVTGRTISQAAGELKTLERGDGKLPTRKTFRAWMTRNGLDALLEAKKSDET